MTTALTISPDISPSLKEAMMVNKEAIHLQKTMLGLLRRELAEQEDKIVIAEEIGLPRQGFRNKRTQLIRKIKEAEKTVLAYEAGYLEIPDFTGDATGDLRMGQKGDWWKINLPTNVPLRVLRAVKEAKEKDLFKRIVIHRGGPDPIVAGIIGNTHFYITSWK